MSLDAILSIISIVISSVLSVISVIFLFITIHQNHKILESSNRPYISIYMAQRVIKGDCKSYIVLKNYGQSPAKLKKVICSIDISKYLFVEGLNPLANINDVILYPNKSIIIPVNTEKMSDENLLNIIFDISYQTFYKNKVINEKININYGQYRTGTFVGAPRKSINDNDKLLEDDIRIISDVLLNDFTSKL